MADLDLEMSRLPVTRKEALRLGVSHYFTGQPCKRGHISPRSVVRRHCPFCVELLYKSEEQLARARDRYRQGGDEARERASRWSRANPERHKSAIKRWNSRNRERSIEYVNKRRALKAQCGGTVTAEDIGQIYEKQCGRCANCLNRLGKRWEVDHRHPLSKGGRHDPSNIEILCITCNRRKGAKEPLKWALENGRLC